MEAPNDCPFVPSESPIPSFPKVISDAERCSIAVFVFATPAWLLVYLISRALLQFSSREVRLTSLNMPLSVLKGRDVEYFHIRELRQLINIGI